MRLEVFCPLWYWHILPSGIELGVSGMSDNSRDDDKRNAERREFLEKCGRFAAVTPPVITLMLAVSDKASAQVVTSPARATTTTTTTTTTKTTTNGTITTKSVLTSFLQQLHYTPTGQTHDLAMIVDSLGVRKIT